MHNPGHADQFFPDTGIEARQEPVQRSHFPNEFRLMAMIGKVRYHTHLVRFRLFGE